MLNAQQHREKTILKAKWLYATRAITANVALFCFIAAVYVFQINYPALIIFFCYLFMIIVNYPHKFILNRIKNVNKFIIFQLYLDITVISFIVFLLGGLPSTLFFQAMYVLVISWSGLIINPYTTYLLAGLASLYLFAITVIHKIWGNPYSLFADNSAGGNEWSMLISNVFLLFLLTFFITKTAGIIKNQNETLAQLENSLRNEHFQLTRLEKNKSSFISIAYHNLRTPLSAIKWTLKMIIDEDQKLNHSQLELLNKAYNSNNEIIQKIGQLLDASYLEEGKYGYHIQKTDILDLLYLAFEKIYPLTRTKGVKLEFVNKGQKSLILPLDKNKMLLALNNIVHYLLDVMPNNKKMTFKLKSGILNVEILIAYKGENTISKMEQIINENEKQSLYDYERLNKNIKLIIAKNIITGHGGKFWCNYAPGMVNLVYISLPIKAFLEKGARNQDPIKKDKMLSQIEQII